mmetsp:Transcript_6616/g.27496  ORF Transcript_6616/g.27496 Transcript_6616/m.27496 type:complete len:254 (+) Transcript_6616:704-1465(+)
MRFSAGSRAGRPRSSRACWLISSLRAGSRLGTGRSMLSQPLTRRSISTGRRILSASRSARSRGVVRLSSSASTSSTAAWASRESRPWRTMALTMTSTHEVCRKRCRRGPSGAPMIWCSICSRNSVRHSFRRCSRSNAASAPALRWLLWRAWWSMRAVTRPSTCWNRKAVGVGASTSNCASASMKRRKSTRRSSSARSKAMPCAATRFSSAQVGWSCRRSRLESLRARRTTAICSRASRAFNGGSSRGSARIWS